MTFPPSWKNPPLQWSRGLSTAEGERAATARASSASFNGAAVFRPRRVLERALAGRLDRLASMEPRSFDRGGGTALALSLIHI